MTDLINLRFFFMLLLSFTALTAKAEDAKECRYETKLWGKLRSGQNGAMAQDQLRVNVIGEMRSGKSVWYNVVRRPGAEPDLVPQYALEEPYPSGTCLSYVASVMDEMEEARSNEIADMIDAEDVHVPVPEVRKPVTKEPPRQNIALSGQSDGAR